MPSGAVRRTLLFAATLSLAPLRSAWAVPPPALDGPPTPTAPVEGPRPPPDRADPAPPPPTLEREPPSGIEFAVPPPATAGPNAAQKPDPLSGRPGSLAELRDPGRAPPSGNWLLVSGGYALPLAGLGCSYYIWALRQGAPLDADIKPQVTSIAIATAGITLYGVIALSVGAYRSYQLQRWARRHRVVTLPQGDGLILGGSLALFSAIPFIPLGLTLQPSSNLLGVTMIVTSVAASAIGGPIMLAVGARRLRRYHETGGWRRRSPSVVRRSQGLSVPSMLPTIMPAPRGVTLGVAGQF